MVAPEARGDGGILAEDGSVAMAVVDLDGLAFVGGFPHGGGVDHGQVEEDDRAGRSVQVDPAALLDLFLNFQYGAVAGFRRDRKAVRFLAYVGQV